MRLIFRLMTACLLSLLFAASASAAPVKIRFGYQPGDINTQTIYAQAQKMFEKAGLDVDFIAFPAGPAMLPAFAAGELDLGWMGEFPIVTGYANGMSIEMILIDRINLTNVRVVVNPKSGIKTLSDLRGKRIGVSIGSTSHQQANLALKRGGLTQQDVTFVNLAPGNMPAAYEAGQVDAVVTWEPNISAVEKAGGVAIATTKSLGDITGIFLGARPEFTQQHPEEVRKVLAVWEQTLKDATAKPDDVRQYEAKRLNLTVPEFGAMMDRMGAVYPSYQEQLTKSYLGEPGHTDTSVVLNHLKDIGDFLMSEKRIKALPADWSKIINTKPLQTYLASKKAD